MNQPWTPVPGLVIRHTMIENKKAVIVYLEHPAKDDGTGPLWVIDEDKVITKEEVELGLFEEDMIGKTILLRCFAYEANLQAYWMPIPTKVTA